MHGIEEEIKKLVQDGFKLSDITILTLETDENSILHNVNQIGKYNISNTREENKVFFTTSRKFKGLESDAVFVIDYNIKDNNDEYIRNFYVSTSRARIKLIIFSNNTDLEINEVGAEINSEFSPIAAISSKFKVKLKKIN